MIETDSSYNKFLSPPVITSMPGADLKLPVHSSVSLHALSRLDPVLASYQAEFTMTLRWMDSRLKFDNLRAESNMNTIRPAEIEFIWFPHFFLDNTRDKVKNFIDDKSVIKVIRKGAGELSSNQETENKLIFKGEENLLEYERFYSEEFQCDFYLHWYPFDYQTCYIDIKPSSLIKVLLDLKIHIYIFYIN